MVLNFASAKHPGGGFLGGATAQEESIARASGLYSCLLKAPQYYQINRKTNSTLYTDHMIYSPRVPIFKHEDGTVMEEPAIAAVITSPAVNKGALKGAHNKSRSNQVMRVRINKMLALALEKQHETLVLGAWGCGVFRNDPEDIAKFFKEAFDGPFKGMFKRVVFAIYGRDERLRKPFQLLL